MARLHKSATQARSHQACKLEVEVQKRRSRPKKIWEEVVRNDRVNLGMDSTDSKLIGVERASLSKTKQTCPTLRGRINSGLFRMNMVDDNDDDDAVLVNIRIGINMT